MKNHEKTMKNNEKNMKTNEKTMKHPLNMVPSFGPLPLGSFLWALSFGPHGAAFGPHGARADSMQADRFHALVSEPGKIEFYTFLFSVIQVETGEV